MKTYLLILFIVHQVYFIACVNKCYECTDNCATPTEKDCGNVTCCFSSVSALGAGEEATTAAAAARKRREGGSMFLADDPKHKFKGCCGEKTADECKTAGADKCYTCTAELCNKGDKPSSGTVDVPSMLTIGAMIVFLISVATH